MELHQNHTDVDSTNKVLLVVSDELLEEFGELSGVKQAENIIHVIGGVFSELWFWDGNLKLAQSDTFVTWGQLLW